MGNTNTELDIRLTKVERMLERYASPVEPKSGEFVGQEWWDQSTEVLNKWNGREFVPAYGKNIVKDIYDNATAIEQTTEQISLKVSKSEVIAEINLSTEGIKIEADNITIGGATTFESGYNPTHVAADLESFEEEFNTLTNNLGALAYDDLVELATLGTTIVQGGYIKTTLIDATAIALQSLSGDLDDIDDGSTYKRVTSAQRTGAGRAYDALNSSNRYTNWLDSNDITETKSTAGYTGVFMDASGLKGYNGGDKTFEILSSNGNAFFKGDITAKGGFIDGTLEFDATNGAIQSSDYNSIDGWKLDDDGLYVGQGKNISLYWDGAVYATHHGYGVVMNNQGIEFYSYIGSNNGRLTWATQNNIDIIGQSIDIEGIEATENFIVNNILLQKGAAIFESSVVLNDSADLYLASSSNRIYAINGSGTVIGYIYFNGSTWRVKDQVNGIFSLAP